MPAMAARAGGRRSPQADVAITQFLQIGIFPYQDR
jgi:hypothetical protein